MSIRALTLLLCPLVLTACAVDRSYPLGFQSSTYGQFMKAMNDCQRAGGRVIAPSSPENGEYRCQMPKAAKAMPATCRKWVTRETEIDGRDAGYGETWLECSEPK
ncbi:hypothetical protein [Phenylobacterium sp. NIBR 498073]|uniref:hypothetical protein n=1 Tax=Phenylobacterium sp. NIBR 498073 TaxID=3015177 RepID=UPI0022B4A1B6|nr:hypothetical protein [Phenylobacterium sp. NIBR 498073]WGU40003.1 hypothetical protein O4N75_20565 [Phenylobacterium sp. NIBR 498073]